MYKFDANQASQQTLEQAQELMIATGHRIIDIIVEMSKDPKMIELAKVLDDKPFELAERTFWGAAGFALQTRPRLTQAILKHNLDCFFKGAGMDVVEAPDGD